MACLVYIRHSDIIVEERELIFSLIKFLKEASRIFVYDIECLKYTFRLSSKTKVLSKRRDLNNMTSETFDMVTV